MPTFATPEPIAVAIELGAGDIRITAADRTETNVEVRPRDPSKKSDVTAAENTQVTFANGVLVIKAPRGRRRYNPRNGSESIAVEIDLPTGSRVRAAAGFAALRTTGRLGECHIRTGSGDVNLDEASDVDLKSGHGDIAVARATGRVEIATGSGAVRLARVDGSATIKNASGDTSVGEIGGDLRVSAARSTISVGRARGAVTAKSAHGDMRLNEVRRGPVVAETGFGSIEVGVVDGVAAWLDLSTGFGRVRNDLDSADAPPPGEDAVEVRARTGYGDITIRRAMAGASHGDR
jgi:hypothetical protein